MEIHGNAIYISAYPSESETYDEAFVGTFEKDTYYYVEVYLVPKEGYEFDDDVVVTVNGKTDNYELSKWNNETQCMIYAKIKSVASTTPITYEYTEGAGQSYTLNDDETATFRINADYSLFENGGKVYVDDKEVASTNYTSKSGSTIITFTKAFMNTLSAGNHTLKVAFNNGGTATTTFTVASSSTESSSTDSSTTEASSTETTSTTNNTTNTTTTSNPATGDEIVVYATLLVIAVLGSVISIKELRK